MSDATYILGISAYYHDSAACLLRDGQIVAAAQEERFTRKKHDAEFPSRAIRSCLEIGGISPGELSCIAFYDKPLLKFERLLETYLAYAPVGIRSFWKAMPAWLKKKLWIKELISDELGFKGPILFPEHHQSHAASAFFASPFRRAAFLTVDGVGEWTTTSWGVGDGNTFRIRAELHFPHSLGLLYSAFTFYTGFRVNSGEYKVMGLAPYGEPKYKQLIYDHLIDIREDGSFRLNMEYFDFAAGLTMTNRKFHHLFGGPPRRPESPLRQRDMDLARSVQEVTEEVMLRVARHIARETGERRLCLAGGVALNCVNNGKLLRSGLFDDIWVQPAAGDAGGALGAALAAWYLKMQRERTDPDGQDLQQGSYLGRAYSDREIRDFLERHQIPYHQVDDPAREGAQLIARGKVLGWFQGRMEFGPRALGNRSILGDARSETMQTTMNLKIKFRESFRPFAPSILEEDLSHWFDLDRPSPYMLLVAPVQARHLIHQETGETATGLARLKLKRSTIPAVTHVDNSARIQSVSRDTNPLYHRLLSEFKRLTGCPVIVNTSFNVRGEPIVESPRDAYLCFRRTEMDHLIMGRFLLNKAEQPETVAHLDWRKAYELD
jgi:carbamoyltransferase